MNTNNYCPSGFTPSKKERAPPPATISAKTAKCLYTFENINLGLTISEITWVSRLLKNPSEHLSILTRGFAFQSPTIGSPIHEMEGLPHARIQVFWISTTSARGNRISANDGAQSAWSSKRNHGQIIVLCEAVFWFHCALWLNETELPSQETNNGSIGCLSSSALRR